jgi:hypothetical protein
MTRRQAERWREHERAWLRKHAAARRYERIFKADEEDETGTDETGDDNGNGERHLVDQLADLLVEAGNSDGGALSREDALRYLLHSERGQALVARMANSKRRTTMDPAVVKIAKAFVRTGKSFMGEDELTKMIFDYAQSGRLNDETPQQAFTRAYTAPTAEGQLLRRAVAVAKQFSMTVQVDVNDDDDNAEEAYAQLQQLAEEQRRRSPELTTDQAFAKVFADPANAALAAKAHRRPVANAQNVFPFPR